jgi:anti-sigma B factor antagonist
MPEEAPAKTLTYEITRDGATATVTCHGRLVAFHTDEFYRDVKDVVATNWTLVLDLADLAYVDSTGLGTLVRLYVHAKSAGCELKLLHLGKQLRNLLKLTNLLSTFAQAEGDGITIA